MRKRLSKRANKRDFARKAGYVNAKNYPTHLCRGGTRL